MRHAAWAALLVLGCSSGGGAGGGNADTPDGGAPLDAAAPQKDAGANADAGKTCTLGLECGDDAVCDPESAMCVAAQCDITQKPCAAGKTCAQQVSHVAWGACYASCVPFPAAGKSTGCPDGWECELATFDAASGTCRKRGDGAADSACTFSDVSTACVAGYTCQPDPKQHFCRQTCDFFAQNGAPSCARADLHCMAPGVCYSDKGDPAKLGEACAGVQNMPCGLEGQAYRGVCAQDTKTAGKIVCSKWCRSAKNECAAGQTCQPTAMPSLGYCQ